VLNSKHGIGFLGLSLRVCLDFGFRGKNELFFDEIALKNGRIVGLCNYFLKQKSSEKSCFSPEAKVQTYCKCSFLGLLLCKYRFFVGYVATKRACFALAMRSGGAQRQTRRGRANSEPRSVAATANWRAQRPKK
jgi:hypothetical protein